jgi:dipeptidyl aminopeptidase/acylaminoacyl peptidase
MHAHKVSTATLNICGALDRCTPSEEARQFHSALVENGVESILVTYPEEGHGVRKLRNWVTNSIFSGERPIATNVVGGTDR